MQYILTKEEYDDLVPRSIYVKRCDEIKELQQMVMKATGYICRYDDPDDYEDFYCDKCPLVDLDCGKRKEFSK